MPADSRRPRRSGLALSAVLTLALTGVLAAGAESALADNPPSAHDVSRAQQNATSAAADVASIQTELVLANQRADAAWVASARAAEAYNGARVQADAARQAATRAKAELRTAEAAAERQRTAYRDMLLGQYQSGSQLEGLTRLLQSDGPEVIVQRAGSWKNAQDAMDAQLKGFRASATVASIARRQATAASDEATRLETEAKSARSAADAASAAAVREVAAVESQRDGLLERLATLQKVSVAVATQRQEALEAAAARDAAEANAAQAQQATPSPSPEVEPSAATSEAPALPSPSASPSQPSGQPSAQPSSQPTRQPSSQPTPEPTQAPQPTRQPTPTPAPTSTPEPPSTGNTPSPARGASAAIAFAKKQLGEPYVWAAAGPNAWDCSGLVMKAWAQGGKSLPHWSVGQYLATTPIRINQLQPGDLLFWGDSSNPQSIYHVAIYLGNDQMIHAPRPGKGVTIESMYYWKTPNFFTRP